MNTRIVRPNLTFTERLVVAMPAQRARDLSVVTVAVVLCTVLSLWGLGRRSLWMDEAISLSATNGLLETLRGTAGTMGLYYVLLDGWTAVFGTSAVALRGLSVICALVALGLAAAVFRRSLGRTEAHLAVVVLAASPALVRYAQEARSYTLVAAITAGAWLCLAQAISEAHGSDPERGMRWWTALAALSALGVCAHGLFPLQLGAMATSLLFLPTRRRLLYRFVPAALTAAATTALLSSLGAAGVAHWVPPLRVSQFADVASDLLAPVPVSALVLGGLAVLGAGTTIRHISDDPVARWRALVPVMWGLVPFTLLVALSVLRPYLIPRYLLASVPGLVMLVAVGAVAAARWMAGPRRWAAVPAAVTVGAIVAGSLVVGQVALHDRSSPAWDQVAELLAEELRPGDSLMVTDIPVRIPLEAAWRDVDTPIAPIMLWTPRPLGRVERFETSTSPEQTAADLAVVERLWLVHQRTTASGDTHLEQFLVHAPVHQGFRIARHHQVEGDIQVLLLVASPSSPR